MVWNFIKYLNTCNITIALGIVLNLPQAKSGAGGGQQSAQSDYFFHGNFLSD